MGDHGVEDSMKDEEKNTEYEQYNKDYEYEDYRDVDGDYDQIFRALYDIPQG